MKRLFICFSVLFCLSTIAYAGNEVPLNHHPGGSTHGQNPKHPIATWYIDLDDNVITMKSTPCDYTLCLYDEDGEVVYTVFVPAGTTQVILPTTLSGDFELRFETATYYYYGYINL